MKGTGRGRMYRTEETENKGGGGGGGEKVREGERELVSQ